MNSISKVAKLMIEGIGIIGLVAGLIFAILLIKDSFSPASESKVDSAYPPPVATAASSTPTVNAEKNPTPEPKPTATPELLENGWYLYRDPDGEFSFEYPPEAIITAGQNPYDLSKNIRIQFIIPKTSYQGMRISLKRNPDKLQVNDIVKKMYENNSNKPATEELIKSIEKITVGGIPGYKVKIPQSMADITIIVPYKDKYFIIEPEKEAAAISVEKETIEFYYKIINTIKY
ncbi:MAG TPA: hypothetical protein PKW33_04335 [Anaerolineaceae bacterium]|nr:hypothetical protein [Anaerolineaceae bacterium]HPN50791.1 hypothetical protein [Anaerolineaceae bacterium]